MKPNTPEGDQHKLDHRNKRLYLFRILKNIFGLIKRAEAYLKEDVDDYITDQMIFFIKEQLVIENWTKKEFNRHL